MILTKANSTELKKVTVKIFCPNGEEGSGTVVRLGETLYVLTAAHVIENDKKDGYWEKERVTISMIRNSMPCNFVVDDIISYEKGIDTAIMRVHQTTDNPLDGLDRVRILTGSVNGRATMCGFHKGEQTPHYYGFEERGEATWAIAGVELSTQPLPPKENFEGTSGGGIFYQDDEKNLYLVAFMSSLGRYDGTNNEFDCMPASHFNAKHLFDSIVDGREHEYSQSDSEASSLNKERCLMELDRSGYDKNQKGFFIQNDTTTEILNMLRDDKEMTIVLTGLSGMGKSKLVYEAFKMTEKLENRYYAKYDDDLKQILRETIQILRKSTNKDGIIIVDDLPVEYVRELINTRDSYNSRFRLIMVNHDYFNEQLREDSIYYRLIKLNPKDMEESVGRYICQEIEKQGQNEADVEAIKQMADGYPQMAIELVKVYKAQNSVGPEAVAHLMPKLISLTPGEERTEKAIWQTLSLCMPFPYKDATHEGFVFMINENRFTKLNGMDYVDRRSIAARLVEKYCPTLIDVQGIWLYVRPFPLAVWLTSEWFRDVCNTQVHFKELIESVKMQPEWVQNAISEGFCKHIQQMSGNKEAYKMVEKLVNADVNHPFFNEENLCSGLGSELFLAMSTVNPTAIATCLRKVLGNKDLVWLCDNVRNKARRNIVWALERLCFAKESYQDGVIMMAKFAAAENEDIGNNASEQLVQLFHMALAGTEVDLKERLKTLKQLVQEGDEYNSVVVRCFDAAFRNGGFTRTCGAEKFGFENKKDYTPQTWGELYDYWYGCRDLLLEWMDKKMEIVDMVAPMVEKNVYHWARGGQRKILVPLMEKIAEKKSYQWDSGYEALAKTVYTFGVDAKDLGVTELMERLRGGSFMTKLNEARYKMHGKYHLGDKEQVELASTLFSPLVDDFLQNEVFLNEKEVLTLLEDDEYLPFDFARRLVAKADDKQLDAFFDTVIDVLKRKPQEFYSSFLGVFSYEARERKPLKTFLGKLRDTCRELLYIALMAGTEDEVLSHFHQLFDEQQRKLFEQDFLVVYLRYFRTFGDDRYLTMLKALRDKYPDRPNDLVGFVLSERFMIRSDDHPEAIAVVKEALLRFKIDGDDGRMLNDYSRILVETLQQWHDVDFAKQVSQKMIKVYSSQMVHLSTEGIFSELLKDYFDEVWPDFIKAFLGEDTFLFYYQVKDELGSGFGFDEGPLFKMPEDLIKQLCVDNPQSAPNRIASMVPCFAKDENGHDIDQFSDWIIWLLDSFGEQKEVRSGISSNLGSFSWTGNISPYYRRNITCFEKLLNHPKQEVREWARLSIKDEKKMLEVEKNNEDFMRIRYEM